MSAIKLLFCFVCLIHVGSYRLYPRHLLNTEVAAREAVVNVAIAEVGIREATGHNDGPRVQEYLRITGIKTRAPWCAAFVSWVHACAGFMEPRTAWSPALFPASKIVRDAARGSVAGIYFPSLRRIAHVGLVTHTKGSWVYTVEGNTTAAGSREGDGVYKKIRHQRTIAKFSDWIAERRIRK